MLTDPALWSAAAAAFATLFVVVDPVGMAPIFVALTAGMPAAQRRRIAVNAVLVAAFVLALFGLAGEPLLRTLGIGLPAFRISGGVMLFLIAVEMLFERRTPRRARSAATAGGDDPPPEEESGGRDPTVFPLATPLIAGPGAMASMILLAAGAETPAAAAAVYGSLLAVLAICLALFMLAGRLERLLGPTGVSLVTRLFGVLLGALAVQFVLDGLAAYGVSVTP